MPIINPQTEAARTNAIRNGLSASSIFYWSDDAASWVRWGAEVAIDAAASNVALESGGNLELIADNTTAILQTLATLDGPALVSMMAKILLQLNYIATQLNAMPVVANAPFGPLSGE